MVVKRLTDRLDQDVGQAGGPHGYLIFKSDFSKKKSKVFLLTVSDIFRNHLKSEIILSRDFYVFDSFVLF